MAAKMEADARCRGEKKIDRRDDETVRQETVGLRCALFAYF
jgi:hypothetical protein